MNAKQKAPAWPIELSGILARVEQLQAGDLPLVPWRLRSCHTVFDNALWLKSIRLDIAEGPEGPRLRTGALIDDLLSLERAITPGATL